MHKKSLPWPSGKLIQIGKMKMLSNYLFISKSHWNYNTGNSSHSSVLLNALFITTVPT
jgi:hypothetical protein